MKRYEGKQPDLDGPLARAFFDWASVRSVIFVTGIYKTGTSLAVDLCTRRELGDPSRQSNPWERGYGASSTRYLTHECSVLRRINEGLLSSRTKGEKTGGAAPERYLQEWGRPIVLKDPQFVFSLPRWIIAARRVGREPGVILSHRPAGELLQAWESAPYTGRLLSQDRLSTFIRGFEESKRWCASEGVPHIAVSLGKLKEIAAQSVVSMRDPSSGAPLRQPSA